MDAAEGLKLLSQFGVTGVALYVLGRIVWQIGQRMITAIDNLGAKWEATAMHLNDRIDAHTVADVKALGDLKLQVAEFDSKLDTLVEWQERTPVQGVPVAPAIRLPQEHRAMTPHGGVKRRPGTGGG